MNNELMILLGCGLAAYAVTNACTSMYENAEESDDENYEGFSCGGGYQEPAPVLNEGYGGCMWGSQIAMFKNNQKAFNKQFSPAERRAIFSTPECAKIAKSAGLKESYEEPAKPVSAPLREVSPLDFGTMVNSSEPFLESDYMSMKEYTSNPDGIKTYNEKDDTVGLPVTDMTDLNASENNKYIYDRTIGTIGFTSTKIGGRFRGQADYIRGDLGIVPNKTGWFQVPSDPANKLMVGAINQTNGIGSGPSSSSSAPKEAGHAFGGGKKQKSLDEIIADNNDRSRAHSMGVSKVAPIEYTAADIINASQIQNRIDYKGINQ